MAGTLTISTLSDGTNSTSATNCVKGSAQAWVNFDGNGSTSIRSSFNVSSVTYDTTGTYTVNFTTAFSDANYAIAACGSAVNTYWCFLTRANNPPTTTSCQFQSSYGTSKQNEVYNSIVFFR